MFATGWDFFLSQGIQKVIFFSQGAKHLAYQLCLSVSVWINIGYHLFLLMVVLRYFAPAAQH